ncbi:dihydrodipicolinate synthase family protein [Bremerella sp. JC770]|uniref:dihydrodipicolinate synthase family protein n=1 Tax=Bremerella sp. JC770 TaxID=3232137 RepID=UPI00345A8D82
MNHPIQGVLPVIHTPFRDDESIDAEALQREVDWIYEVGADGLCAAMVSEILRLSPSERFELIEMLVQMSDNRGPVIASVGAETTRQALEYARHAQQSGCAAVMAIPPISTGISDEAAWDYFSTLAREIELPLIVQDASSYVGKAISTQFFARLLNEFGADKILFKPEAAPIGPLLSELRDQTQGQAQIFDGSGGILLVDCYRRGIRGTMPGVDLLDAVVLLWRALKDGDDAAAYQLYFPICAIVALQLQAGLDGFLAIEKYLLQKRGIFTSTRRRMPYQWELDHETASELDRLFDHLQSAITTTAV